MSQSSAPYGDAASVEMQNNRELTAEAKPTENPNPNPNPISERVPSQAYLRDVEKEQQRRMTPPLWARVTSLVLIVLSLAFTIATLGLEANMYKKEQDFKKKKEPSDSDNLDFFVFAFIGCGLADCAASVVALIVCLVLTAATPRLVLVNPATHSMNCFCATMCILACASGVSIGLFATLESTYGAVYPKPLAVPIIRTVFMVAYFAVLLAAKCVKRE